MEKFDKDRIIPINKLEGYHILNSIKPAYFQTKFPYDKITANKVIFTKRKIEIMVKEYESFKKDKESKKAKSGGGSKMIIFYG
jgi:hypothetical protein